MIRDNQARGETESECGDEGIIPYRTSEEIIGGVVITIMEITVTKAVEMALWAEIARLQGNSSINCGDGHGK